MVVCSQLAQAESLEWNGTAASNTWNTESANTVWKDNSGTDVAFSSDDDVTFGTLSGDVTSTVKVESDVAAGSVTVNDDYTVDTDAECTIAGVFGGTGKLIKGGQYQLTLDAADGSDGLVLEVSEGNLVLAGTGSYAALSMAEATGLTIADGADITLAEAAQGTDALLLGKLTVGDTAQFNSLSGDGSLVLAEGKSLQLAAASYIGSLQNGGNITSGGMLSISNEVAQGGAIKAPALMLGNGGSFTSLTVDSLILASAPSQLAPVISTGSLQSDNGSIDVQIEKIVRGSGDYTLVASETELNGTSYTLNSYTAQHYLDYGYIATLRPQDNALVLNLETTDSGYFARHTTSANGYAGARLLDAAFGQLDPQANSSRYPSLAAVMDAMDGYIDSGNSRAADELAASVAGAGITAINAAFRTQMERQMREIRNRLTTMNGGMPCDPPDPKAPAARPLRYTLWANAEIDYQNQRSDGALPGYKLNSLGGTAGFAALASKDLTLGAAFTGMAGRLNAKSYGSSASGDLDAYYANIFARYDSGCWSHSLIGTAGFADVTFNRYVNYGNGAYSTHGSTDGLGLGVMYEVARTYRISEDYMASAWWQPVFNVAYIHSQIDSYTESGSDAALRVGKQESNNVIFGLGARMQTVVGQDLFNSPALMEARVLGKATTGSRRGKADVSIPGVNRNVGIRGADYGPIGIEIGLGFSIPLGTRYGAIITDCTAEFTSDQSSVNGVLGYRIDF